MYTYVLAGFGTFVSAVIFSYIVKKVANHFKIVDNPDGIRKIHKHPTPLLGGLAIFVSFFVFLFFFKENLVIGILTYQHWLWFFAGATVIIIGGILDDKYHLKPAHQIIWPLLATACVIAGNIGISKITNPLGGFLQFSALTSSLFTFVWIMIMMYTTKLLDGVDGLVTGISAIGGLIIFLFTITTKYYQPDIALVSLIFAAACLGFLVLNWHPAKIFLGEGGSLLLGYVLGTLAIISGGKIAIALLVLGLPLLDIGWTILRRLASGKNPFKTADRSHLHHRLLDLGIGQRKTVLFFYTFSLVFGLSGLFLQSRGKLVAIILLISIMVCLVVGFTIFSLRNRHHQH